MSIATCEKNRVFDAVDAARRLICDKLATGTVTPAKVESIRKAMDMTFEEYCSFQELKSLAVAQGTLSLEEGQVVYSYLGENLDTFNDQPLEVKVALTKLYSELLGV